MALASADRGSENVFVLPVVILELELRNLEREILGGNPVESPDRPRFMIEQKQSIG
jgi:hypothetical protein